MRLKKVSGSGPDCGAVITSRGFRAFDSPITIMLQDWFNFCSKKDLIVCLRLLTPS